MPALPRPEADGASANLEGWESDEGVDAVATRPAAHSVDGGTSAAVAHVAKHAGVAAAGDKEPRTVPTVPLQSVAGTAEGPLSPMSGSCSSSDVSRTPRMPEEPCCTVPNPHLDAAEFQGPGEASAVVRDAPLAAVAPSAVAEVGDFDVGAQFNGHAEPSLGTPCHPCAAMHTNPKVNGASAKPEAADAVAANPEAAEAAECPDMRLWCDNPESKLPTLHPDPVQPLRVFCGVWNLHGKPAPSDVSGWLVTKPLHHIYVIGTCECERSIGMSLLWKSKARWEQQVKDYLGGEYMMVAANNMSAIHVMVFVHKYLWKYSWDIRTGHVATGFADMVGNKGGTQIGLSIGRTSLLFVHAHLAAHQGKMNERTQNLSRILVESPLRRDRARLGVHDEFDRVFVMGDLNPRVDAKRSEVDAWLAEGGLEQCLERDQLLPLLRGSPATASVDGPFGMWPLFEEAAIDFPPTYKYDTHTDRYDSSKKQRVPSWTDRILWKRDAQIRPISYTAVQSLTCSDHRPVLAQFEVDVDLTSWDELPSQERRSSVCSIQ